MSLKHILLPETKDEKWASLYCDSLTANSLVIEELEVNDLTVNNNLDVGEKITTVDLEAITSANLTGTTLNGITTAGDIVASDAGLVDLGSEEKYFGKVFIGTIGSATQPVTNGIYLPGATPPQALAGYEEYYDSEAKASGIWAADQATEYKVTKIGRLCTLTVTGCVANANTADVIEITPVLPERLRPSQAGLSQCLIVRDDGANAFGGVSIGNITGSIVIYNGPDVTDTFSGTSGVGSSGFETFTISYVTATQ